MKNQTYVIGEIGQNHNGSVDIAKLIIELASRDLDVPFSESSIQGLNAVKLTKRDLNQELTDSKNNELYNSPNSFGRTYGEHRRFLELNDQQHFEIYKYAKSFGLDFVETLCAPSCTSLLKLFTPDYLKVASRDLTNLPLLEALAETKIPIILSTGMAGRVELDEALEVITKYHSEIAILHCTSEYPTKPENTNLNSIRYLLKNYTGYKIGFSDHTIGISAAIAAVALGATIIEKHITIDRNMKGTDQKGSLGPDGIYRMMRDIRLIEKSMGEEDIFISDSVISAKIKLERSLATRYALPKGHQITLQDLQLLSPGDGYRWSDKELVVNKVLNQAVEKNEIIYPYHID